MESKGKGKGKMGGVSREAEMSMAALSMFPGFRFSPKDEELILFYLKKKLQGSDDSVDVISEIEICKFEPWDLPGKSRIPSDNEWFFFSPRGRKYPNGTQNKRATELGYWKATGKERNVKSGSEIIGTKRTLVFHLGRAPTGERTEWIMHEYCLNDTSQDSNSMVVCRLRKNNDFRRNNSDKAGSSKVQGSGEDGDGGVGQKVGGESDRLSKNCSSSFDSHSLEQIDSGIEFHRKETSDPALHESLSREKGNDEDEELYADLLKDDIITLDDNLLSATQNPTPMIMNFSESEKYTHLPIPTALSEAEASPCQGSITRRIKLKKLERNNVYINIGLLTFLLIIFIASLHVLCNL
ncbi:NAC domain-containing protein 40-like [Cucurbita maxima]|uniref:NAC domain-containing protein 40-like n=1 Tax=Cucurbita maxima TaxID=3661 RepID=A0A6J1JCJ3_CUCMA|nr:NAC domain-containing protein 40-like [Cucurbita maxima]